MPFDVRRKGTLTKTLRSSLLVARNGVSPVVEDDDLHIRAALLAISCTMQSIEARQGGLHIRAALLAFKKTQKFKLHGQTDRKVGLKRTYSKDFNPF